MPNTVISTSIDKILEREVSEVLAPMGLTVSEAFRLMLVRIAEDKTLPFKVRGPNAETVAAMEDARAGRVTVAGRPDQLLASLDADDWLHDTIQKRLSPHEGRRARRQA